MAKGKKEVVTEDAVEKISGELKLKKVSSGGVVFELKSDSIIALGNDSLTLALKTLPADFDFDTQNLIGTVSILLEAVDK